MRRSLRLFGLHKVNGAVQRDIVAGGFAGIGVESIKFRGNFLKVIYVPSSV